METETSDLAMRDFILSSSSNLRTALLVHRAFDLVAKKLISELAMKVENVLKVDQDWVVVSNTLARNPLERYAELKWAPREWETYGWGLTLSSQMYNARGMMFGLHATAKNNKDRSHAGNPAAYPAMPDQDRTHFAEILGPLLRNAIGRDAAILSASRLP